MKFNNETIRDAVKQWLNDASSALSRSISSLLKVNLVAVYSIIIIYLLENHCPILFE